MANSIMIALLVGVVGTGVGGLIGAFASKTQKILNLLICFTAGVMAGMAVFDLIPEAVEGAPLYITIIGLTLGALLVAVAEKLEKVGSKFSGGGSQMMSAGVVIAFALMLHNLPEGFVVGAGGASAAGIERAWLIALHDIPAGMAVALPLVSGGMPKFRAAVFAAACGLPLVIGAAIGSFAGELPAQVLCLLLAVAAGSMVFVSAYEISIQKELSIKHIAMTAAGLLVAFAFLHI